MQYRFAENFGTLSINKQTKSQIEKQTNIQSYIFALTKKTIRQIDHQTIRQSEKETNIVLIR